MTLHDPIPSIERLPSYWSARLAFRTGAVGENAVISDRHAKAYAEIIAGLTAGMRVEDIPAYQRVMSWRAAPLLAEAA